MGTAWIDYLTPLTTGISICSDLWGNQGIQYLPAWNPSEDWQKLEMEFPCFSENMTPASKALRPLVMGEPELLLEVHIEF